MTTFMKKYDYNNYFDFPSIPYICRDSRKSRGRARYTANTLTDMSHIFPDPHIQTCLHRQSSGMHDRNDDKMRKK